MSALFAPTGPIDLFVTFRDGASYYLGNCREAPEVEVRPAFIDIKSDIGGRSVPTTKVYDGEQHLIYLTATNRFGWSVYKAMQRATVAGNGTIGNALNAAGYVARTDGPVDRGSLVLGGTDFQFTMVYQFGTTAIAPELPVGRRYFSAIMLGSRESTVGSRIMEVSMVLECNAVYTVVGNGTNGGRSFSLYTEKPEVVLSGLPNVN